VDGSEQHHVCRLTDLELCGLNALPDRMGVGSSEMPIGEECQRRQSGFVNHLICSVGPLVNRTDPEVDSSEYFGVHYIQPGC